MNEEHFRSLLVSASNYKQVDHENKKKLNLIFFFDQEQYVLIQTKIQFSFILPIEKHSRRCSIISSTCRLKFVTLILFVFFSWRYQVNIIVHHHHHLSFHNKTWREISIYSSQHPVLYCNWSWQVHSTFTCKFPIRMLIRYIQSSKVTPQTI